MKERFPRVTWYTCSPSGVLAVADPVMTVQYDTRYDSKVNPNPPTNTNTNTNLPTNH